jgi:hypothetical protein
MQFGRGREASEIFLQRVAIDAIVSRRRINQFAHLIRIRYCETSQLVASY